MLLARTRLLRHVLRSFPCSRRFPHAVRRNGLRAWMVPAGLTPVSGRAAQALGSMVARCGGRLQRRPPEHPGPKRQRPHPLSARQGLLERQVRRRVRGCSECEGEHRVRILGCDPHSPGMGLPARTTAPVTHSSLPMRGAVPPKIAVSRNGVSFDVHTFGRIPKGLGANTTSSDPRRGPSPERSGGAFSIERSERQVRLSHRSRCSGGRCDPGRRAGSCLSRHFRYARHRLRHPSVRRGQELPPERSASLSLDGLGGRTMSPSPRATMAGANRG